MGKRAGRIYVGTSGWVYRDWKGLFYPDNLPGWAWLEYYAGFFSTVELNNTFYRLPSFSAVDEWRDHTPRQFVFATKGSRFLTHMKRLKDVGQGLENYFSRVNRLDGKLGPVLWQLPARMKPDAERLAAFLAALPGHTRHVFEFREPAWHSETICQVLDHFGTALCEHDLVSRPTPRPTGGFRYVRFHGATAPYSGRYGEEALRPAAESFREWSARGRDLFAYFNNDRHGHAVLDAFALRELLGYGLHEVEPAVFA